MTKGSYVASKALYFYTKWDFLLKIWTICYGNVCSLLEDKAHLGLRPKWPPPHASSLFAKAKEEKHKT